jgi:23S rRNA G2445 N2-methylase RlmL
VPELKLSHVSGLRHVVVSEISKNIHFSIIRNEDDSVYISCVKDLDSVRHLRSVSRAYIVLRSEKYNPLYISKHKSLFKNLIETGIAGHEKNFKTFKITCAGSSSPEVQGSTNYIKDAFKVTEKDDADLKVHIIKIGPIWEIGVQITSRPLSLRDYKVAHMSGAMDPTIAYAVNSLCDLETAKKYLNIFSGSATLLIEAAISYPNLEELIGFDNNKKHLSLAIQNIKKAGLLQKVTIKEANIFDTPNFGMFDAITADVPFGMVVSKGEDLELLYKVFIEYCEKVLHPSGKLVIFTTESEILEKSIQTSKFQIRTMIDLKYITSVNAYLRPRIFVCAFK